MRSLFVTLCVPVLLFSQDNTRRIVPASFPGRRVALVVGNKAYTWNPLMNPDRDARAVARSTYRPIRDTFTSLIQTRPRRSRER